MIVCVGGRDDGVNVYEVGDRMGKKGWNLNSLQVRGLFGLLGF